MTDVLAKIEMRKNAEAKVREKLLLLALSKPLEQLSKFPDWENCSHVDLQTDKLWPDVSYELPTMINSLVGYVASKEKIPIDVCIVRISDVFALVVRTE